MITTAGQDRKHGQKVRVLRGNSEPADLQPREADEPLDGERADESKRGDRKLEELGGNNGSNADRRLEELGGNNDSNADRRLEEFGSSNPDRRLEELGGSSVDRKPESLAAEVWWQRRPQAGKFGRQAGVPA